MKRTGYSLIEMIAVIGIVAVTLGLIARLLHGTLHLERSFRDASENRRLLAELAQRFRTDAHAAASASAADGGLSLTAAGRTIRYEAGADSVRRLVSQDGQTQHRDAFRLPPAAAARFELNDAGGLAAIVIEAEPTAAPARIEAAVGLDAAWSQPAGASP